MGVNQSVFLSAGAQYDLQTGQRILFGLSSLFNLISLFCLIKETPPNQAKIRNYLLMTQVAVILNSIYMDILFEPIPLFPALAGICTGVLCKVGVPLHTCLGGAIMTYIFTGAATFFCIYFRYQTLLPESKRLSKPKSAALIVFCLTCCIVPASAYAFMPFDLSQVEHQMITSPYNIGWAIKRGPYFIHERTPIVAFFLLVTVMLPNAIIKQIELILASVVAFLGIFLRMFYVLNQNKKNSPSTTIKIRKSLKVLFVQGPVVSMFVALLLFADNIPFEMYLFGFSLMSFHPILHNVVLLGITPTYRQIIEAFLCSATQKPARVAEVELPKRVPSLAWAAPGTENE